MDADAGMYEQTPKWVFSYMSPWFDFFTASPRGECTPGRSAAMVRCWNEWHYRPGRQKQDDVI
jgi:hypothetical protein